MVAPQPFFRPRGTPFSVLHRIRAMLRLGHQVDLVTYPFGESPVLPGLTIHRAARFPAVRDVTVGPSWAKVALDLPLFSKAYRLARRGGYDLLHTHEEAGVWGALIARRVGLPHLYDMHSSLPEQFANFGRFNWGPVVALFRRMERFTLEHADGVIAICPELHDHVVAQGYPGPVALIENTLDFEVPVVSDEDAQELREHLRLDGAQVVLYTGTLEPYQGLDLLLAAAPRVAASVPAVRVVIVGGTAAQAEELRLAARQQGAEGCLTVVPAVAPREVFRYHRIAHVLVTSRIRGTNTPLKIYQYLRAGKPIVATAIRSHTQVLDPSSAELVPASPEALAAGIVRVLTDPAHAQRLAGGARQLAEGRYAEAVYFERLEGLLAQLAGRWARRNAVARPELP